MARSKKALDAEQAAETTAFEPDTTDETSTCLGGEAQVEPPGGTNQAGLDGERDKTPDTIPPQTDLEFGETEVSGGFPPQPDGEADGTPAPASIELDDFPVCAEPETQPDTEPIQADFEPPPGTGEPDPLSLADWDGSDFERVTPELQDGLPPDATKVESAPGDDGAATAPTKKLRLPGRGPRVVSIDAERSVETDADRQRSDLLDLMESFKGKKILSDTIQGVERPSPGSELSYAVIYHGDFKVIIPVSETVEEPEDYRGQPKGDVLYYMLNKRLGAEVDYIVKGIDPETGIAVGSRLEAMAMKRKEYYFRTDRDGNYQIYEGIRAEARVVSVIRAGIFIDLFGAECYIPLKELSYQRWMDAAAHYQPGQRVLVKVLEVDRSDRNRPRIAASVKQAGDNPYEKALQRYAVGCLYVGSVSLVDLTGVFVSLDGGIDCLCSHPKRGRPPRGARVTVRILGMDHDTNRIWGVITHMSTAR